MSRPMIRNLVTLGPGLALVALTAALARLVHSSLPIGLQKPLGEVIFAVGLGLLAGSLFTLPTRSKPGIDFAFHALLRWAIVLLGARLSLGEVASIGAKAVGMVVFLMGLALVVAHFLGRVLGVPPRLASLIGIGTSVCGNTAISATAPVIGAQDKEVSFALATNTVLGTAAVFLYPFLGSAMGFGDAAYGTWIGTAVNDTSQVVAAGYSFSDGAGDVATTVKLTRNALMGFVIVLMGMLHAPARAAGKGRFLRRLQQSLPPFVLGFLSLALLRTLGVLDAGSAAVGVDLIDVFRTVAEVMILMALAGVGLGTRATVLRDTGFRPFIVGLATAITTSSASVLLILWLGGAGQG